MASWVIRRLSSASVVGVVDRNFSTFWALALKLLHGLTSDFVLMNMTTRES